MKRYRLLDIFSKNRKSIQWKTFAGFMIIYLIAITGMLVFYNASKRSVYNYAQGSMQTVLSQLQNSIEERLQNMSDFALLIAKDSEIQKVLREGLPENATEYYEQRLTYNANLLYRSQYEPEIEGCYVIGENHAYFKSSTYSWRSETDYWNEKWYQDTIESRAIQWITHGKGSFLVNALDAPTVMCSVPILDRASTGVLGAVAAEISASELSGLANQTTGFTGELYLLSSDNTILYSSDAEENNDLSIIFHDRDLSEDFSGQIVADREKFLLSNQLLSTGGLKVVGLIAYDEVFAELNYIRRVMIWSVVTASLFALLFAVSAVRFFTRPILSMQDTMEKVADGDMDARVEIVTEDEIGILGRHFNSMIDRVQQLRNRELDNQKKLRQAELNALQAQINPHFLYNALDSINWLARMKRNDEVINTINALSGFYRISLSRGRTYITLKEEFQHAEHYITIQKMRYKRYLNYESNLPEQLSDYACLKMILQPLIENSIYHGIKEKGQEGFIFVSAKDCENTIEITIEDDGMGINQERLTEIRSLLEGAQEYDTSAYGIINVQRRIRAYFGEEYGIHINSIWQQGTTVIVRIPKRREGENHNVEGNSGRG